ncbi:heterokaryon incompatibility protein-domain-containing protein [Pisolithus orientalis]|uniref:heterokaryon incompatibility protein-domain-containing protein n=1 Tax=Pisolithus orientalis TaxID=936130 RepID=UPI002225A39B|nr:heterokaryon incompatibility protein-domain-containing protein [Pisolithus orientalis]KAI5993762.1 heterokaryon incompatibility protein-domain-containing protein [Pisolithus orientalis]
MRLLSAEAVLHREKDTQRAGRQIKIFEEHDDGTTKYAILSHRWRDEVDYDEMSSLMRMAEPDRNEIKRRSGYEKIIKSCEQALQDGYMWIWIDTCCIDKRNEPELSGAIRSMYRWYSKSQKCYAYLDDVEDRIFPTKQDFSKFAKFNGWPEWFSRGWTLQELVAPKQVEFFNKDWVHIGGKQNLANTLEKVTQIPIDVLKDASEISRRFCVAQIMSWAADRKTTRVEDRAYSLLGLFGVNMPIYYDEKEKAFHRLQLEIIGKFNDHSIFAWNSKGQFSCLGGALAGDPNHFRGCHDIEKVELDEFVDEVMDYYQSGLSMTRNPGSGRLVRSRDRTFRQQLLQRRPAIFRDARSIQICLPVIPHCDSASVFRAILACRDYYGDLITIDLTSPDPLQSSYRICSGRRFRHWGPELRTLCLAYSAPDTKEYHHFKVDDRHTLYHRFSRHGTFPREFTGDTITVSSLTNDLVVIVYANDGAKSRFAVAIGFYLGQGYVHVAYDDYSATDEVPWRDFAKKVSDRLWSAPVEDCSASGVKCAHLPRAIWDARVVWYSGNMQTNVMVDVQRCSGCCIGPHERISASNDGDGLDMPGFMKAVHKFRGLKLDGKLVWVYQCADQKIALGDYGDYSNGTFRPYGNIFKDMQVDDIDPAYRPVASCVSSDADVLHRRQDQGLTVEFDERLTLHSPEGFSLPNNQQLVLLLKAFSIRLAGKHLVTTIIQCSDLDRAEGERGRKAKGDEHFQGWCLAFVLILSISLGIWDWCSLHGATHLYSFMYHC